MAQARFDMGTAFAEARALLRSHRELVFAIAGVFLFLPAVLVGIFGPVAPGLDQMQGPRGQELTRGYMTELWPYQLAAAMVTLFGTTAILRIILGPAGTSVGNAIGFAFRMFPTALIVWLATYSLTQIGLFGGPFLPTLYLFLIPGVFLSTRLAVAGPHIASASERNPLAAISQAWQLSRGNFWTLLGYLLIIGVIGGISMFLLTQLAKLVFVNAFDPETSRVATEIIAAILAAILGVILAAAVAGAYRQLTGSVAVAASPDAV